jgi:Domain of unknown function (DUF4190)
MTIPPAPEDWQNPAGSGQPGGWPVHLDPNLGQLSQPPSQPSYVDPVTGLPASVSATPAGYPAGHPAAATPAGYPAAGYPAAGYPAAGPGYPAADQTYLAGYPPAAYQGYPGYGYAVPIVSVGQKTNGFAIASLVVSLSSLAFVICYGAGGLVAALGAIFGHVARWQIARRGEGGGGMALAGIIIGWLLTAVGLAVGALMIWFLYDQIQNNNNLD